ncbi:amino acid adenylation domain-containing protein [Salmonella enterica]|nr:amino acid adenylation domain-containing protein [Salmonella enterica]ECT8103290.1 amino acid adenylation domain-containing protein [Salmonella enterica subsp. enterica serovar Java]EDQ0183587.1 amino acid adenylation domain-containing protein [Salmonella enterica subsp. enterica serovar 4,[5],12:b:-]EEE5613425.1 amino acid adenylation domain-containing protein [Salmonella enterica subsp. enterica serovar Typhimurium]EKN5800811.1 amino acid adenylation domain-containing protein [Salmonella e
MENIHQKLASELPGIIARFTGLDVNEIDEDANLIGLGIDSITMMRISGRWRQQGVIIGFHELISSPSLSAWQNLLNNASVYENQNDRKINSDEIKRDNKSLALAPMQHAYWIGRRKEQFLGGVSSHFYHEFNARDIDPLRLEKAVDRLMERHEMLRVSISDEGQQFIPDRVSAKKLVVHDLRLASHEQALRHLKATREYLSVRQMVVNKGEVFDIQITLLPEGVCSGNVRLHIGMDMIAADAMSLRILLSDLEKFYCEKSLPVLDYTYFDWLVDYRKEQRKSDFCAHYELSRKYWSNRLPDLPGSPLLPTISLTETVPANNVVRRHVWIDAKKRKILEQTASRYEITMAFSLASAFAEIVTAFSDIPDFIVNLPLFNRQPLHHQVEHLVGDFTSSVLLAWNGNCPGSFCERARRFQQRFHEDVVYANYSGIELLRDLSRYHEEPVYAPIVFTSALGLGELFNQDVRALFGEPVWIVSQGPQVLLDIQISELNSGLLINWDAREEAFLPETLDLMFAAYVDLVEKLISQPESWLNPVGTIVSENILDKRCQLLTRTSEKSSLLHDNFFIRALQQPEYPALFGDDITLSYSCLSEWSRQIAALLVRRGMISGERVAVSLPKGPGQIAAVLGVLFAGGVYVPVGIDQPAARRQRIYQSANIRWQIGTESDGDTKLTPEEAREMEALDDNIRVDPESEAYIIFTSGSTGEPKGVMVSHAAAVNTLEDINRRFGVTAQDRLLAVSALDFDLSVYDIFGILGAGASLVLIDETTRRDATAWLKSIKQHGVTIWNSVPVLLEMLLNVAEGREMLPGLRLALISGDWIGLNLPGWLKKIAPECRFAALGGATEAAVWSNLYEVEEIGPDWKSIPYGYPLTNQAYRVVDSQGRDCPDWVAGELWIGGRGVALGYCGDPEKTAEKFVSDERGKRWYRTGDIGRYWPDGTLEFLGRQDQQIKIRGHRIETGEIEAAIKSCPGVGQVIATVHDKCLVAAVTVSDATTAEDLKQWLRGVLAPEMIPDHLFVLSDIPLSINGKVDRQRLSEIFRESKNNRTEIIEPPKGETEVAVAAIWSEILGTDSIDRYQDFFSLGGDSLQATRVISRLHACGFVHASLSELFLRPVLHDFCLYLPPATAIQPPLYWQEDNEARFEPFSLTEVQQAYLYGRQSSLTLGGIGCHFYKEFNVVDIDIPRLEQALGKLICRHDMLRAVFDIGSGKQRVLPEVPEYRVTIYEGINAFQQLRLASHQVFNPEIWPLFSVSVAHQNGRYRIAIGIDNLILDALSVMIFYRELDAYYQDLSVTLPPVNATFRDYLHCAIPDKKSLVVAQNFWMKKAEILPSSPQLPLAITPEKIKSVRFKRRSSRIDKEQWQILLKGCQENSVTPSALLLTAFCHVLSRWSSESALTINLTLFERTELHPDVSSILGDFTSLLLIPYFSEQGQTWINAVRNIQREMWAALDHRQVSAISVLRERARRQQQVHSVMPVVFTSALGLPFESSHSCLLSEPCWGISQTPQVWLDFQVAEIDGNIEVSWDAVEELFHDGMLDILFSAYFKQLEVLIARGWQSELPDLLTESVLKQRREVCRSAPYSCSLLHDGFFIRALQQAEYPALLGDDVTLSYSCLSEWSRQIAALLVRRGMIPGERVAVSLPKGPGQIVAVLGVLFAGGVYVPVGIDQPAARRQRIYQSANIRWQIGTESDGDTKLTPEEAREMEALDDNIRVDPESEAYIIFTSGSTGEPKGVMVSHAAAVNTLEDINRRFGVTAQDRLLAVSALDFDLSVYDIFGILGAGASLVLIDETTRRDATAWLKSIKQHGVTIWNSVPVLLEMLLNVAEGREMLPGLRLALISGDWIGLNLPGWLKRIAPECRFAALGGATEAAVWSNLYEVEEIGPDWKSIPYGYPLTNQSYRVVDSQGRDCPDWVAGELWIGGRGVALGYCGDPEKTAEKFVSDERGKRWYRTGDIGRYWPDGTLEFLGRQDQQIKIRGHRIEPGEIEAALCSDPSVGGAIVVKGNEKGRETLIAGVVPALCPASGMLFDMCSAGILPDTNFESEVVESILTDLLGFREQINLSISDAAKPLYNLWISWLKGRGRLIEDNDGKLHSSGISACIPEPVNDEQKRIIDIANAVIRRTGDYRNILCGELDARILLDDPILAPEILMNNDPDIIRLQSIWASILRERARLLGRTLNIAELGGRSGVFAERLLGLLAGVDVNYTLLDASSTLVNSASQRLTGHSAKQLPPGSVPDTLLYQFDVVLCVNSLHRYPEPQEGAVVASLLLKHGGLLLATEFSHLSPLALFTSAVLEMGYTDFDTERRQAGSPTLSGSRWCKLLGAAWFDKCTSHYVGRSFLMDIEAVRASDSPEIHSLNLFQKLRIGLPEFMIPGKIVILPVMPLSSNGKRDGSVLRRITSSYSPGNSFVPPESEMELWVAEIWETLLDTEILDKKQGFFDIGGDSLMATRFLAQVRQILGVDMSMSQLFMYPTLNLVAEHLQNILSEQCKQDDDEGKI